MESTLTPAENSSRTSRKNDTVGISCLLREALRQKLLKHNGGIPKLKPAPANSPVGVVLNPFRNPPVLHFEAKPVDIKPQRSFHVVHAEKRHSLLYINACNGCDCNGSPHQDRCLW